jgi:hypothetical protein
LGEEDVEARKSRSNDLGNLFEDVEFVISVGGVSFVVSVVEVTFSSFSGETSSGRFEFLRVFVKSSHLVFEGRFDFVEFEVIGNELSFGSFSHGGDFDH